MNLLCGCFLIARLTSQPYPNDLRASNGAYSAHLSIKLEKIPNSEAVAEEWWGALNAKTPVLVVTRLDIDHNKHLVRVPVSAYSGLTMADTMMVIPNKRGCIIRITGSDAAAAYTCEWIVRGNEVVQRTVRCGEFPDLDYEKTTYRTPRPGEID